MSFPSLTTAWPAASVASPHASVFGREQPRGADAAPVLEWLLKRNCSITPKQLLAFYLSLCVLSLAISLMFMLQGAPFVLVFAGLELTAVAVALLIYARHAGDRETLTLDGRSLRVEQRVGHRVDCTDFTAEWLSVEPAAGQGSLIQLSGEGRSVRVGRFIRPELRPAFARELRLALRRAPGPRAAFAPDANKDSP